jgi:hypothetical protein
MVRLSLIKMSDGSRTFFLLGVDFAVRGMHEDSALNVFIADHM